MVYDLVATQRLLDGTSPLLPGPQPNQSTGPMLTGEYVLPKVRKLASPR